MEIVHPETFKLSERFYVHRKQLIKKLKHANRFAEFVLERRWNNTMTSLLVIEAETGLRTSRVDECREALEQLQDYAARLSTEDKRKWKKESPQPFSGIV